jgi:hypothetical protein
MVKLFLMLATMMFSLSYGTNQLIAQQSKVKEWKFEYWEWQPNGREVPPKETKDVPKDAKFITSLTLYRSDTAENTAIAKFGGFVLRVAIAPGDVDRKRGN